MSYGSEAADQVVRMTLNGVEVAARITGKAAERLAALIYSIIKDNRRTRGKGRLNNMLKSGKELAIFTIKDRDMVTFAKEAKRYGILYCVLKDKKANDGVTDIMVKEIDANKINRIFERYGLYDFTKASIKAEVLKGKEKNAQRAEAEDTGPEKTETENIEAEKGEVPDGKEQPMSERDRISAYFQDILADEETKKEETPENPTQESRPSGHSSGNRRTGSSTPERADEERDKRPSVKKELEEIKKEQEKPKAAPEVQKPLEHIEPKTAPKGR